MNQHARPSRPTRRAFTLIELIAAMVVISVIGAIGAMSLQRTAAANSQVAARGSLYAEASAALDRIVRKLQSTPMRTGSSPAAPSIASFSATTITWDDQSTLAYDATAQTLSLRDIAAGDAAATTPVLIGGVTAFSIQPIDQSNADLFTVLGVSTLNSAQSAAVRRVSVQLTVSRQGQSVTLRTRAFLRCVVVEAGT